MDRLPDEHRNDHEDGHQHDQVFDVRRISSRLVNDTSDGVENSLPEILANFRGPVSIGGEYHGNLPQVGLSNQQQPHGGCDRDMRGIQSAFNVAARMTAEKDGNA
jgi:hypothetical protein